MHTQGTEHFYKVLIEIQSLVKKELRWQIREFSLKRELSMSIFY